MPAVIGRLVGQIVERSLEGACVVDVGGVGYEVFVPASEVMALAAPPAAVTLHIHTQVREDAITLYGFTTDADRQTFRVVLGVSGVGPRIALSILGALGGDGLAAAVTRADLASLKAVSGVGKKLAERLVLELKDKLPVTGSPARALPRTNPPPKAGNEGVLFGALVSLGYKPAQAEAALQHLGGVDERPVEELLREALARLA